MENQKTPTFSWTYVVVLILALGVFGVGIYLAAQKQDWSLAAAGCLALIAVLVTWPIAAALEQTRRSAAAKTEAAVTDISDRLQQIAVLLTLVSEQQLLSDRAKAIAFREKDREALRRAIQEELLKGDNEAALALADSMESSFGYSEEATRIRHDIGQRRDETLRKQITEAVGVIDRHTRAELWNDALLEADKVMKRFPNHPMVANLPQEIEARRQAHKKQLLEAWQDAGARKDVDGSIELLKKLDNYLTPSEAEALQEDARNIFREKLNNLRQQFTVAVQEHRWSEALRIGDSIVRDFPNTRIAVEVREKLDTLRERASSPEVAKV